MRVTTRTEPINQAVIVTVDVPMLSRGLTLRSDWGPTRRAAYRWEFDELAPHSTVEIDVAGLRKSVVADSAGRAAFEWDGLDANGTRPGQALATARLNGSTRQIRLGRWDPRSVGLGGLLLSGYDYLDPIGRRVYAATGRLKGNVAITETADGYEATRNRGRLRTHFDRKGFIDEVVDSVQGATVSTYQRDHDGHLQTVSSPRSVIDISRSQNLVTLARAGWELRLETDEQGRVVTAVDASDRPMHFEYDGAGQVSAVVDASGFRFQYEHDEKGRLVGVINPGRGRVDLVRTETEHGHRVALVSAEGRESQYQVDRLPDGTKVRTSRCCGMHPAVTRIVGGRIEMDRPDGTKIVNERATQSRRVMLPSGLSRSRTVSDGTIDVNRQSYQTVEDASSSTLVTPSGRRYRVEKTTQGLRVSGPGGTLDILKDDRGRTSRIVRSEQSVDLEYDSRDLLTSAQWGDGSRSTFEHDDSGWLTRQRFSEGRSVELSRDGGGLVRSVDLPGGAPTRFEYAGPGLLASVQFPAEQGAEDRVDWRYDADGLLISRTPSGGVPVVATRDAGGQIESIAAGDSTVTFEYDNGRVVKGTTSDGQQTSFRYDGQLLTGISQSGPVAGSVEYEYDEWFRRSRIVAGGLAAELGYDADGDLAGVGQAKIERDAAGRVASLAAGVVTQRYEYSESGRVTRMVLNVDGREQWSVDFGYDRLGRITSMGDSSASDVVGFRYDDAGRLAGVSGAFEAVYDANGNPVRITRHDVEASARTGLGDRLTDLGTMALSHGAGGVIDQIGEMTLVRDGRGRVVATEREGVVTTYRRDCFGFLVGIDRSDGTSVGFVAGPHGWPEAVVGADGTIQTLLAGESRFSPPLLAIEHGRTLFLAADHVGSVRRVIDTVTGEVVDSRDYDVWGRLSTRQGSASVPHGFAGGIDDPANDLVLFPARTYSPEIMRWLSRDPELFLGGSANLYSYCNNDPVNYRDPSGTVVEICRRAADMWFAPDLFFPDKEHWWLRTTDEEAGMVSGGNNKVGVGDHTGQGDSQGSECDPVPDVDEECVERHMQTPNVAADGFRYGESLGYYGPGNTCQNWVDDVLTACSGGDYTVETENPDAYDNWYGPEVDVAPYSPTDSPVDHTPDPGQSTLDAGELWQ